ncbi:MAG: hypothetical protein QGH40_01805 [bacterium]|jgi:hypothetical protein|nr:hypothetical protein [bacterium]
MRTKTILVGDKGYLSGKSREMLGTLVKPLIQDNQESWMEIWRSTSAPHGPLVVALLESKGIPVRTYSCGTSSSSRSAAVEDRLFPIVLVPRDRLKESQEALQKEGLL